MSRKHIGRRYLGILNHIPKVLKSFSPISHMNVHQTRFRRKDSSHSGIRYNLRKFFYGRLRGPMICNSNLTGSHYLIKQNHVIHDISRQCPHRYLIGASIYISSDSLFLQPLGLRQQI